MTAARSGAARIGVQGSSGAGRVTDPPTVQITRGVQLHLLDLLDLLDTDITRTRRPQTYKGDPRSTGLVCCR
ncbi:hypothetical protein [Streptomyces sp. NPDC050287]|uniref:hypothetical protein n=1 Tax=Streptomyces sp. NPDC050287 TaxID=3365608 RepID=UPI0037BA3AA2